MSKAAKTTTAGDEDGPRTNDMDGGTVLFAMKLKEVHGNPVRMYALDGSGSTTAHAWCGSDEVSLEIPLTAPPGLNSMKRKLEQLL